MRGGFIIGGGMCFSSCGS